jgi:hypothetical protein
VSNLNKFYQLFQSKYLMVLPIFLALFLN